MKVSVSLPGDDIEFLDDYVKKRGLGSRSAALRQAVRLLRTGDLSAAYAAAWDEWAADADDAVWVVPGRHRRSMAGALRDKVGRLPPDESWDALRRNAWKTPDPDRQV